MSDRDDEFDHVEVRSEILFLQLNDLYQIDCLADYADAHSRILPRLATARGRVAHRYPGPQARRWLRFCLPGDFLAPSCLSRTFKGEHMVDVLNCVGIDFVTFGNHEFEEQISEQDLIACIRASKFRWLTSNIYFRNEDEFDRLHRAGLIAYFDGMRISDGSVVLLVGLTGGFLDTYDGKFFSVLDPSGQTAFLKALIEQDLAGRREHLQPIVVALTHQPLVDDKALVESFPDIHLVMGGHEHNIEAAVHSGRALIIKTESNARTFRLNWVLAIRAQDFDRIRERRGDGQEAFRTVAITLWEHTVLPALADMFRDTDFPSEPIPGDAVLEEGGLALWALGFGPVIADEHTYLLGWRNGDDYIVVFSFGIKTAHPLFQQIPADQSVNAAIDGWLDRWRAESGFSRDAIVVAPEEFDATDSHLRSRPTNFGRLIAHIIRGIPPYVEERDLADIGVINSGAFRLDRNISKGEEITQRTLCEMFFHANTVCLVELTGENLRDLWTESHKLANDSHGDYLQFAGLTAELDGSQRLEQLYVTRRWAASPVPLELAETYSVATIAYVPDRSEHHAIFDGRPRRVVAADLVERITATLRHLAGGDQGKASLSLLLRET